MFFNCDIYISFVTIEVLNYLQSLDLLFIIQNFSYYFIHKVKYEKIYIFEYFNINYFIFAKTFIKI